MHSKAAKISSQRSPLATPSPPPRQLHDEVGRFTRATSSATLLAVAAATGTSNFSLAYLYLGAYRSPQQASTAEALHEAVLNSIPIPGQLSKSVMEVLNCFLKVTGNLIGQNRAVTTHLRHIINQKSAENRILHDKHEAHFCHQPCCKRKSGDSETCSQDNSSSVRLLNFFREQPDLSMYIQLPEKGQSKEPVNTADLRTYSISDQHRRVIYNSGCVVNMENTLHRFVQPRLYPLNLTELKADC